MLSRFSKSRRKLASNILADVAKYSLTFGVVGRFVSKDVDMYTFIGILLIASFAFFVALISCPREN